MPDCPPTWTLEELRQVELGVARVWATPSVAARVEAGLPLDHADPEEPLPEVLDTLVVVGGGALLDRAKAAARERPQPIRLVAVASIWGSGAEASPVVVLDRDGHKEIRIDPKYVPDRRVLWPELAASIPRSRARLACADCWAHALEGFASPLADDRLRTELAEVIRRMLDLPLTNDPRWFEPSALACAAQARSSAGLVHGIAHTLEAPLRTAQPSQSWGHARLCAAMLWPVMQFNRRTSEHWSRLADRFGLDEEAIFEVLREVFDAEAYSRAEPILATHWRTVLRNPCTRTNSVLVRPGHLEHFQAGVFV